MPGFKYPVPSQDFRRTGYDHGHFRGGNDSLSKEELMESLQDSDYVNRQKRFKPGEQPGA